jgi:hypothetical protein
MKRVALDLAVNGRAMPTRLMGHLVDRHFCRHQLMEAPPVGEGNLRIASKHAEISEVKPLKLLACRTWK